MLERTFNAVLIEFELSGWSSLRPIYYKYARIFSRVLIKKPIIIKKLQRSQPQINLYIFDN